MTKRNGRSSTIKKCIIISAVALFLRRSFICNESISIPSVKTNKIIYANVNIKANADFSVNFNINFNNSQIVILAGPHKTASTT